MTERTEIEIEEKQGFFSGSFRCMASPCTIFIDDVDRDLAYSLTHIAACEAARIEHKFSRFRTDNIIYALNHSKGRPLKVDSETALLLDFAQNCYEMSEGLFDITSGVLRRIWTFDGSANIPANLAVEQLLHLIGWSKVDWNSPNITLPPGMELDLGGIGKEYAVDKTLLLLKQHTNNSILVNFGGDLSVSGPRKNNQPWLIGVEKSEMLGTTSARIELSQGALTTSGDSHRFLKKDGIIYSHVLDPLTGWPIKNAPRSVTVAANNCTEAGILSTLAMLKGTEAESFLNDQGVKFWCQR